MASFMAKYYFSLFLLFFFASTAATVSAGFVEKTTHLHFYFHDIRAGTNATSLPIISAVTKGRPLNFGGIGVFQNALTIGPARTSKRVGSGEGMVVDVSLSGHAIMTSVNFVFTDGKYKGSSVAMYGRADLFSPQPAERPIIGGSGVFRMARGFSLGKIIKVLPEYVLAEFDLYVKHYVWRS